MLYPSPGFDYVACWERVGAGRRIGQSGEAKIMAALKLQLGAGEGTPDVSD